MADKIVYVSLDNGMDGRDKESIVHASWTQEGFDALIRADKNRAYQRPDKRIVDVEKDRKKALKKLNALDRLLLGIDAEGKPLKPAPVYREVLERPAG